MPTPMHVYAEIAARYVVDPADSQAVDHFFKMVLPKKPRTVQPRVVDELLARDTNSTRPTPEIARKAQAVSSRAKTGL